MNYEYFTYLNSSNPQEFKKALSCTFQYFQNDLEIYLKKLGALHSKDLVQEVFINLMNAHANGIKFRFEHHENSVRKYLKMIAFRAYLAAKKRRQKLKEGAFAYYTNQQLSFSFNLAFQEYYYNQLRSDITKILSKKEQVLFYLVIYEERSYIQIAQLFQVSAVSIRVRWYRIGKKLRANLLPITIESS